MISRSSRRFDDNPKFRPIINRAMTDIEAYWRSNVERYFSHAVSMRNNIRTTDEAFARPGHTGQMRNACKVTFINNEIIVIFKAVHSEDGKDYGDYLVYGTSPSQGKYIPEIGSRMREKDSHELIGQTRGISTIPWNRWMVDLDSFISKRLDDLEDEIYKASSIDDVLGDSND